ncbi:hypothetical protein ACFYM5_05435 [Streptomyces sp. NPDC006706]|uniref:hypothetical protein n=1 Tax=Streptomyces sp. NPDC006706 TaxID=3364761 RepID=UPI003674ABC0
MCYADGVAPRVKGGFPPVSGWVVEVDLVKQADAGDVLLGGQRVQDFSDESCLSLLGFAELVFVGVGVALGDTAVDLGFCRLLGEQ